MESSKRIKTNLSSSTTILDLPSDPLLLILSRLDQIDLRSLSLVSKPFLHLSNHFVRKLIFFETLPDDRSFRKIFNRFSSVKQINLSTEHVDRALIAISKSQLNLEALEITNCPTYPEKHQMLSLSGKLKIKSLSLFWFSKVKADQVVEFIRLFPSLEELHFGTSYQWDDAGIESLSLSVPNLRKIDLGQNRRLTDRSLYALSVNCVNLEYIGIEGCHKFTSQGFCTFLLGCRNLRYLDLLLCYSQYPISYLPLAENVSTCENLHHLTINFHLIKDDTLGIIAKSRASLTSLCMKFYTRPNMAYTMTGVSAMLSAFQGLTRLSISLPRPVADNFIDKRMSELVKSLPCLIGIAITSWCLIHVTLLSLIENCHLLKYIDLNMKVPQRVGRRKVPLPWLIRKNYSVKYIRILPSPNSSFEIALASFCPCLRKNWDGYFPSEVFVPNNPATGRA